MIRIGTSHFTTLAAAQRYYAPYGLGKADVQAKINQGEIHIGRPKIKEGQRLDLDVAEGRYIIVDNGQVIRRKA